MQLFADSAIKLAFFRLLFNTYAARITSQLLSNVLHEIEECGSKGVVLYPPRNHDVLDGVVVLALLHLDHHRLGNGNVAVLNKNLEKPRKTKLK
jgi:hypothetical protein